MTFSTQIKLFIILTSASLVVSCKPSDADVHKLVEKTLDNMVFVKGGTFMMGDGPGTYIDPTGKKHVREAWTGYKDNKPAHPVELDSYYIQKYEVTYGEYDIFAKATGRPLPKTSKEYKNTKTWRLPTVPVQAPSWYDAKAYCQWLGDKSGLPIDLPTEAQWEYAARSRGKYVPYATDNGWLEKGRNWGKSYTGLSLTQPKPVGMHPPNPLGIYDMQANECEWVDDWYDSRYYSTFDLNKPTKNPKGPKSGKKKICRGADLIGTPWNNTIYNRFKTKPDNQYEGMRCVLNIQERLSTQSLKIRIKSTS